MLRRPRPDLCDAADQMLSMCNEKQVLRAWRTEVERVLLALSGSPAKRVDAATTGGDGGRRRVSLHTRTVAISRLTIPWPGHHGKWAL